MDTEQYVFVKCKIVGKGTMCYTLEEIIDLVVVGMENGEYNHKFSIFKDDSVPLDYFDTKIVKKSITKSKEKTNV